MAGEAGAAQAADPAVLFIDPDEAFRRIGISRAHGYRLIKAGVLPSVKLGRSRRISVRALEAWADRIARDGLAPA